MNSNATIAKELPLVHAFKQFDSHTPKRENDPGWDLSGHDFGGALQILSLALEKGELRHALQPICILKKNSVRVAVVNLGLKKLSLEWSRVRVEKWDTEVELFGQSFSMQTVNVKFSGALATILPGEYLWQNLTLKPDRLLSGRQTVYLELKTRGKSRSQQCHLVSMPR